MNEKEKRIPFPCHPKACWMLPDAKTPPRVYTRCGVCAKVYEIDTVKGTMRRMVPDDTPKRAQALFDQVNEILDKGNDAVLRRDSGGGIKIRVETGYTKVTI